jgi:hypothetical protein
MHQLPIFTMNTPQITPDELKNASPALLADLQVQLKQYFDAHQAVVQALVEKVVYDQIQIHRVRVNTVEVRPSYEYNDEGYAFNNVMVSFNGYEDDYYDDDEPKSKLQSSIDNALGELAPMLKEDFEIDVRELEQKFGTIETKKKSKVFGSISRV